MGEAWRSPRAQGWALFTAGVCAAALGALWLQRENHRDAQVQLIEQSRPVVDAALERVSLVELELRGSRAAILASGGFGRREFLTGALEPRLPGRLGAGFARRVPVADQAAFLARARKELAPDFELHEQTPNPGERWVIELFESLEGDRGTLGFDLASSAALRSAADRAMTTGQATLSDSLESGLSPGRPPGSALLLLPLYRPGAPVETPAQRHAATFGWTFSLLVLEDLFATPAAREDRFEVHLVDALQASGSPGAPARLQTVVSQPLYGREVTLEVRARPRFEASLSAAAPLGLFGAGALLSGLLGLLLASRRREPGTVAPPGEAQVLVSSDGAITRWSPAAQALFGVPEAQALGQPLAGLVIETSHTGVWSALQGAALGGEPNACRVVRCRRGGSSFAALVRVQRQGEGLECTFEEACEKACAVASSERDLRQVLDTMPAMIGSWDRALLNRFANDAYAQLFGLAPSSLRGRHLRDILGEDAFERERPYRAATLRGERTRFERTITAPDGTPRHTQVHYLPEVLDGEVRGFFVMINDVTDLTESQQKLAAAVRENEALLGTLRQHTILSTVDIAGTILDVNDAFCALSGYSREELVGKNYRVLNSGVHPPELWATMRATLMSGKAWRADVCNRAKDGSLFWLDSLVAPFFDERGRVERFLSIRTDITASKNLTVELARERERLTGILRATNVGTWEWNAQTGESRIDEHTAAMLGYSPGELTPEQLNARVNPADLEKTRQLISAHLSGALPFYELERRIEHRLGHWIWLRSRGRVSSRTHDGKPEWLLGTHQDVTDALAVQRRVAASEAFLERAGHLAGVGGLQVDLRSREVTLTREVRRMLELPEEAQLTLDGLRAHYFPEDRALIETVKEEAVARGTSWDLEARYVTNRGRTIWARTLGEAEYEDGAPVRYTIAVQDISKRRASEEALRQAIDSAVSASAAKSEFLANMSHEIRTPLNAVIGLSHLLDHSELAPDQRATLGKIQLAGRSLLGIINAVLDLSKIEAGQMSFERQPFELHQLLREVEQVLSTQALAKGLELRVLAPAAVPRRVVGDVTRVRQIITNLISNAIKFTPRGSVELGVSVLEAQAQRARVLFSVRDTGIGIDAEALSRLFTPFTQADASTTRKFGGTGLGLSIVRRLAEMMGGEVGVKSTLGTGSEFWVVLPFELASEAGQSERGFELVLAGSRRGPGRPLGELMHTLGWRVEEAAQATALRSCLRQRLEHGRLPDVLVVELDAGEPELLDVLLQLSNELGRERLPAIVAVSAGELSPRARALSDALLSRPVTGSSLFNAVNAAVARRGGGIDGGAATITLDPASRWLVDVRVLVVDDSLINLEVARRLLEREGAIVTTRANGLEALEVLRARPAAFDLVAMDVQMPLMDGNEAAQRIRTELGLGTLPIIALTAGALVAERQRSLEAGFSDFLTKPIDAGLLVRTVRRHVELTTGLPVKVVPRAANERRPTPPAPEASVGWPVLPGIDGRLARQWMGEDFAATRLALERTLKEYADLCGAAGASALEREPPAVLAARMHKLKGTAGMLGAGGLQHLAAMLEESFKGGQAVGPRLERLGATLAELEAALRALPPAQARAEAPAPAALPEGALEVLGQLLDAGDLSARDHLARLGPALRGTLGEERFSRLRAAVDGLRYEEALGELGRRPAA